MSQRIRITFTKQGALRYTGHLDLHSLWERAVRRAGLPLSYSQGFHPQPRISLASALPLGFSSQAEVLDARLNEELPLEEIRSRLQETLPPDIRILEVKAVDEKLPALQTQVLSAEYEARFPEGLETPDLDQVMAGVMAADSIPRERRGKAYDLRPLIESLELTKDPAGQPRLHMVLSARDGATGRPEEVLAVLGLDADAARVERLKIIFKE